MAEPRMAPKPLLVIAAGMLVFGLVKLVWGPQVTRWGDRATAVLRSMVPGPFEPTSRQ